MSRKFKLRPKLTQSYISFTDQTDQNDQRSVKRIERRSLKNQDFQDLKYFQNLKNHAKPKNITEFLSTRRRDSVAPDLSDTNHMDVHISLLPAQHWSGELNCAPYQTIADAITLGCIRCHVNSSVIAMREEISQQLGDDKKLPSRYIFLKGVGRALVPIRPKQEQMLTVENFRSIGSRLPPEICLLDTVALDKSHSGQTLPESRGSRSNLQKNFKTNDSGIESSTQLKDRVNQNVRDRQKPEKKEVKEVRKPVRSMNM